MRVVGPITPAQFIRQHILRISETELARLLEVHQTAVTRYTKFPRHHEAAVKRIAWKTRKIRIRPEWFSEVPFRDDVPKE